MDFIKKASGSGSTGTTQQQGAPQQDYGDKGTSSLPSTLGSFEKPGR